jgi:hypothetical protein
MSLASPRDVRADAPLFADGLGDRYVAADAATGEPLQILSLMPALTAVPSFEFAVRERIARFVNFRPASYACVRRVDRLPDGRLVVVSDHVEGIRLSDVLAVAYARGLQLDTSAALCLIGQLVAAVALMHENARDASHGLLAPERLILTAQARLVVVEHVIGSALEQLQYGREHLWREFRAAMPASAGMARFDHRADVNGIGITALSLILGRPLAQAEFPHAVPGLLMQACERSHAGGERPLPNALRNWLARTLQLDVRRAFPSAPEALAAFAEALAADPTCVPAPVALETFLAGYLAADPQRPPDTRIAGPAGHGRPATPIRPPAAPFVRPAPLAAASGPRAVPTLAELIAVDDLAQEASTPPLRQPAVHEASAPCVTGKATAPELAFDRNHVVSGRKEITWAEDSDGDETEHQRADQQDEEEVPQRSRRPTRLIAAIAVVVALAGAGLLASRIYTGELASGTLVVQSSPAGVEVYLDGVHRGVTPARLSVPAGSHILELRGSGVPRVIPLHVPAGGQVSQYLEFADTPRTGMLVVHSQPAGARVTVDGTARGVTPLTIDGLEPGDHEVVLQNDTGSSRHVVKVLAGTTASLVAPVVAPAPAGPVSGWITVKAPFLLEIFEAGRLIGTTETDRLMLAAGGHVLEFVNQALGYRETRTVQVLPGKVLPIGLDLPKGSVSLNADPWAEVWIDGRSIGETPIGNLELTIGAYEIVFRHPQFGERRHAVSVTTAAPVRLSVAMR